MPAGLARHRSFIGVGAYTCYATTYSRKNIIILILARLGSAAIGTVLASPRPAHQAGFYLASPPWRRSSSPFVFLVRFLALQPTFRRDRGADPHDARHCVNGPNARRTRHLVVLSIVTLMTWVASNLCAGRIKDLMAVRDMDIAPS
jgi:hypothetical protein